MIPLIVLVHSDVCVLFWWLISWIYRSFHFFLKSCLFMVAQCLISWHYQELWYDWKLVKYVYKTDIQIEEVLCDKVIFSANNEQHPNFRLNKQIAVDFNNRPAILGHCQGFFCSLYLRPEKFKWRPLIYRSLDERPTLGGLLSCWCDHVNQCSILPFIVVSEESYTNWRLLDLHTGSSSSFRNTYRR